MPRIAIALVALLVACVPLATAETNYSRSADLQSLRISFDDLQATLDKISTLVNAANKTSSTWREELQLRKGEMRVKISGHRLAPEGANIPPSIDSFDYTARTFEGAPITEVTLRFDDFRRSVSVEGQSPEQVDAVFSVLRDDLSKLSTPFGGYFIKAIPKILLFVMIVELPITLAAWVDTRQRMYAVAASICVLLLILLFVLPFDQILTGFLAVRGDASFSNRYAPEISLWGLIIGLVALAPPMIRWIRSKISQKGPTKPLP